MRLSLLTRKLGIHVPWIFEEIVQEWFGGPHLDWDPQDVESAFNMATQIRGNKWVLGPITDTAQFAALPGIGRRGGYSNFLRVYWFGKRMETIVGAAGATDLISRVVAGDAAAEEEATAIYLLRSKGPSTQLEIEPGAKVASRSRKPDFRIKEQQGPWVYVEVTKLHASGASIRVQELLERIADQMMIVQRPFVLELLLNRELTDSEEEQLLAEARRACESTDERWITVTDVATILVKSGQPAMIVPSLIPDDAQPRMALSKAVVGPGQPNRQILARVPFADQRAENILKYEARQLPKGECGLLMVNVNLQPSAFESWGERIPQRFTPRQHTRVAGVILFMHATSPTERGLAWIPYVKLIANPHAAAPLPTWITNVVAEIRAGTRRLTGRPD